MADDEPVAEHADRGQVLLHGRGPPVRFRRVTFDEITREIRAFKPQPYWEVVAAARSSDGNLVEFEVLDEDTTAAAGRGGGNRALRFREAAARVVDQVREAGRVVVVGFVRSAEEVPASRSSSTGSRRAVRTGGGCWTSSRG